jgi:hypothetical protein
MCRAILLGDGSGGPSVDLAEEATRSFVSTLLNRNQITGA